LVRIWKCINRYKFCYFKLVRNNTSIQGSAYYTIIVSFTSLVEMSSCPLLVLGFSFQQIISGFGFGGILARGCTNFCKITIKWICYLYFISYIFTVYFERLWKTGVITLLCNCFFDYLPYIFHVTHKCVGWFIILSSQLRTVTDIPSSLVDYNTFVHIYHICPCWCFLVRVSQQIALLSWLYCFHICMKWMFFYATFVHIGF
jgi:hypothetical protein